MSTNAGIAVDRAFGSASPFRGTPRSEARCSSADLIIVRVADSDLDSGRIFPSSEWHPSCGRLSRIYQPLYYGEARRDGSFMILERGEPKCFVCCTVGEDVVDYYGQPVSLFAAGDGGWLNEVILAAAIDHLKSLAKEGATIWVSDFHAGEIQSALGAVCSSRGFTPVSKFTAMCDLSLDEDSLRRALRKSYRSLVNWGRKSMRVVYVNADNPDWKGFKSYQEFHFRVAGRVTRPQCTWDAMYEWIAGGRGELSLGYLDTGDLVAGTMIVDGETTAAYASGVYDRERFDLPVAHGVVHDAILRSRGRGLRWFELGDVPERGTVSDKEYSIGFFKSGFATEIRPWTTWVYKA